MTGIVNTIEWSAARKPALDAPYAVAVMRPHRAAALRLTYEQYKLDIVERCRHLNAGDSARMAQIITRRR